MNSSFIKDDSFMAPHADPAELPSGECCIQDHELLDHKASRLPIDQVCMVILRDKGAPIKGVVFLSFDDRYTVVCDRSPVNLSTKYNWRPTGASR